MEAIEPQYWEINIRTCVLVFIPAQALVTSMLLVLVDEYRIARLTPAC